MAHPAWWGGVLRTNDPSHTPALKMQAPTLSCDLPPFLAPPGADLLELSTLLSLHQTNSHADTDRAASTHLTECQRSSGAHTSPSPPCQSEHDSPLSATEHQRAILCRHTAWLMMIPRPQIPAAP